MDNKQRSEFDQAAAFLGDSFPGVWHRLFVSCQDKGFTEEQSFRLVQTYILAQCPHGVNSPPKD